MLGVLESFEMWCWRRMEKINWTDHVRNEEVLLRVKKQRNIIHEISKWKANWIGHILHRNCLLWQVIEWKVKGWIEVTKRRGRRRRNLLGYLKERRRYSHLKEEGWCYIRYILYSEHEALISSVHWTINSYVQKYSYILYQNHCNK
jgi:hypothetical protein